MASDLFLSIGRRQHSDPVAEFQHEVGRGHQVGVVATNVQEVCWIADRHRKISKRHTYHIGLSDEDADVVEVGAIAGQSAGL